MWTDEKHMLRKWCCLDVFLDVVWMSILLSGYVVYSPLMITQHGIKMRCVPCFIGIAFNLGLGSWSLLYCSITSLTKVSKWAVNTTLTEILVLTSTSAKECYPRIHRLSLFSLPFSLLFSLAFPLPLANQRR